MIETISAGVGIVSGIAGIFGGGPKTPKVPDRSAQIGATAYQNFLSRAKTRIMNDYRARAYERTVARVYEQFDQNYASANAAFQTEIAKYGEQLMAFAYQKEGLLRQLDLAEGYAAATESYGVSADRAKAIQTIGDYGRNESKFVQSVVSAQRQFGRTIGGISGSLAQANMQTMEPIYGGAPIRELEARGYKPNFTQVTSSGGGGFFNSAMKIMGGVQTGLSAYKNFDSVFNPESKFLPKNNQ